LPLLALVCIAGPVSAEPAPSQQCLAEIAQAERDHKLPPQLLLAIGRVESGRANSLTGVVAPWPWTINAEGQGRFFETKAEAVAAVADLQARGIRLIDVGCLQVNLHHHPAAFASLEAAFDPATNARYAGLFLNRLHAGGRDWDQAAANYHSSTAERAEAYRLKILAAWPAGAARLAEQQRLEALAGAWRTAASGMSGFQAVAMELRQRQLEPPRRVATRRVPLTEIAEAPR
jgi:hypothetical protein